jgi:hypothetical protein
MLKRIALLGAMAALLIVKPSNAVAQGWDGWGGLGVPFPRFCCGEHRFFPRRDFCCAGRRFFSRPVFFEEHRFFPRPFWRPPYFYGDRFAPYVYNPNAGYTDDGYGYY